MVNKILIIDFNIDGHWVEYINHFINTDFFFQYSERFHFRLSNEFVKNLKLDEKKIDFSIIENKQVQKYYQSNYKKKNKILKEEILNFNIVEFDEVFLLNLSMAIKWINFKKSLSGILYNSPLNYQFKFKNIKGILKSTIALVFFSKALNTKNIFLLNNLKKSRFLKAIVGKKLHYLVDPVNVYEESENFLNKRAKLNISENKIFLHIGSSQPYKGTNKLVEIISKIKLQDSAIIILGKLDEKQKNTLDKSNNRIIMIDQFIGQSELHSLFRISNITVITNENTSFSSGILNLGLHFENFIIAPKENFFYKILKNQKHCKLYKDQNDLFNIINEIDTNLELEKFENKVILNYPSKFSKTIINNLCAQ